MRTFADLKVGENIYMIDKSYSESIPKYYLQSHKVKTITLVNDGIEINPRTGYGDQALLKVPSDQIDGFVCKEKFFSCIEQAKKSMALFIVKQIRDIEDEIKAKHKQIEAIRIGNYDVLQLVADPEIKE